MQEFFSVLHRCPLFARIQPEDMAGMLGCLGAKTIRVRKHQAVFNEGDPAIYVGIVLSGMVQIVRDDYYGNRSILGHAAEAELFGESFACAGVGSLPVSIIAATDTTVMLINCQRITRSCSNACAFHNQMILNLLQVVAARNLAFHQKIEITAQRTTREKLMAYLLNQAKLHGSNSFTIPYDRQALADYLGVERSAMSAEISKLRADGVIECERSHFRLL